MTRWLIRLFCFVAVLLGGASISFASDCASAPNECTPKSLCEVATEVIDGNKLWSTSATSSKYVSFAQELGMNCGVVELKDPCDTDPNQCKINQLCEKATIEDGGTKSWNSGAEAYVEIAQEYGLECGIDKQQEKASMTQGDTCLSNPARCDDTSLCTNSTRISPYNILFERIRVWETAVKYQGHVEEAKKRGLTCAVNAKFDLCYFDLSACKNQFLCKIAVEPTGEWKSYNVFADEAKRRGLTCGVKTSEKLSEEDALICRMATINFAKTVKWAAQNEYVDKAKRRGLTCGVGEKPTSTSSSNYEQNATETDFRQAFISQSQLKRKQLQYALKELSFYKYRVDGLWGKGTKKAFEQFAAWANLEGRNESSVFRDLLTRVDVPSSFNAPQQNTSSSSSSSNSNSNSSTSYYKGMRPLISNPSASAEQAWAICEPQARLASNEAQSNSQGSGSRTLRCKSTPDFLGGTRTRCAEGSTSGGWPGLVPLLLEMDPASKAKRAGERVYSATMDYCLAKYGWKR